MYLESCDNCGNKHSVTVLGHNYDHNNDIMDHMILCQECCNRPEIRAEYKVCYCFEDKKGKVLNG